MILQVGKLMADVYIFIYIDVSLGGGSKCFYLCTKHWGNDPIWQAYFSTGLKLSPRSIMVQNQGKSNRSIEFIGGGFHMFPWLLGLKFFSLKHQVLQGGRSLFWRPKTIVQYVLVKLPRDVTRVLGPRKVANGKGNGTPYFREIQVGEML